MEWNVGIIWLKIYWLMYKLSEMLTNITHLHERVSNVHFIFSDDVPHPLPVVELIVEELHGHLKGGDHSLYLTWLGKWWGEKRGETTVLVLLVISLGYTCYWFLYYLLTCYNPLVMYRCLYFQTTSVCRVSCSGG